MNYPSRPGVYWFLKNQSVIYVGKAKNLKNRLRSYRRLAQIDPKTNLMLKTATGLRWKALDSEIEAILTEAELIRLYQPRFNLIQKDDRSPIYLTITSEAYPRVFTSRGSGTFGPFTSVRTLREILRRLRRIFPFCDHPESGRACFYYHLSLCPGACIGQISPAAYQKNIRHIRLFFQNKKKRLLAGLKKEMTKLAQAQNYTQAKNVKNQLEALDNFWQARWLSLDLPRLSDNHIMLELKRLFGFPVRRIETYDIANLSGIHASGAMVAAVNGRIDKSQYRLFNIRSLTTPNDPAMLTQMVKRRLKHPEWGKPDLIVVDGGKSQINAVKKITALPVVGLAKNPDRLIGALKPLSLDTAAGRLLVQLRDEAHRFGRKQHLRLRRRALLL